MTIQFPTAAPESYTQTTRDNITNNNNDYYTYIIIWTLSVLQDTAIPVQV
jgi:hypothetical protein